MIHFFSLHIFIIYVRLCLQTAATYPETKTRRHGDSGWWDQWQRSARLFELCAGCISVEIQVRFAYHATCAIVFKACNVAFDSFNKWYFNRWKKSCFFLNIFRFLLDFYSDLEFIPYYLLSIYRLTQLYWALLSMRRIYIRVFSCLALHSKHIVQL